MDPHALPVDRDMTCTEKKLKIGFYLGNRLIPHADLRFPEAGNPGVGGSEFGPVALPYFLSRYSDDIDPVIYANVTGLLPDQVTSVQADNSVSAVRKAIGDNCQIFVVRLCDRDVTEAFVREINGSDIRVIAWAHNNPSSRQMAVVAACENISRLVCVGREELDLIRDHVVFYKSTYIFNGIHFPTYGKDCRITQRGSTVVYLGSLVREKGFHVLAKAWPSVKKRIPSAHLIVIGSGSLYNENAPLGLWGIADERYEREFRRFLSDPDGRPDSSVSFLGRIDPGEKISILRQADLGVANPNFRHKDGTETFCWSAVEFEACGVPVVSAAEDGLLDTVIDHKTGLLVRSVPGLAGAIVRLLEDNDLNDQFGRNAMNFVRSEFDFEKICSQWRGLFQDVIRNSPPPIVPMKRNVLYRHKFLREFLRRMKMQIPRLRAIPALLEIHDIGIRGFLSRTLSALIRDRKYIPSEEDS